MHPSYLLLEFVYEILRDEGLFKWSASLSTFTLRRSVFNIKEILINETVLKGLLISLSGLTDVAIQKALINDLIILLNSQIL